jgi:hypothetical protein
MFKRNRSMITFSLVIFGFGLVAGSAIQFAGVAEAQTSNRVFELRTYTTHPDRLEELQARFRDHTVQLFERHGMTNIGYFTPQESPLADNTLIYLLAHDSREAAEASWAGFAGDPDWLKAAEESRRNGRLLESVVSVFLDPTDYSRMK